MTSDTRSQINMATGEVSFKRSDFAVVVFPSMPETFPIDAHIECRYTITPEYEPTRRDWVGLYKVGWISSHNYLYYEWSSPLTGYVKGKEFEGNILFPAHQMPDDDGEFYQFCFVASTGQVKGASTPFQFKRPRADDFVEMMDDENDMLVIHSRTCLLEENLKSVEEEKTTLLKKVEECEAKYSNLTMTMLKLDCDLKEEQKTKTAYMENLKLAKATIQELRAEVSDTTSKLTNFSLHLKTIDEENKTMESLVEKLKTEITELNEKIKFLQNQKDEAIGKYKLLEEEKEMYKSQLSSREKSVFETQVETEKLRNALKDVLASKELCEKELVALKTKMDQEKPFMASKKEEVARLSEKLRNSEDKLCAAESTKEMLQKELSAYEATLKKMSSDLEASRGESLNLKVQLEKVSKDFEQSKLQHKEKVEELVKTLNGTKTETRNGENSSSTCLAAGRTNENLKEEASTLWAPQSIYHLQKAQETLQERYSKVQQQNYELNSQKEEITKKYFSVNAQNQELLNERREWQLRVNKCSEEYKKIYAENKKNVKKLEKLKSSMCVSTGNISDGSQSGAEGASHVGTNTGSGSGSGSVPGSGTSPGHGSGSGSSSNVNATLDELRKQLLHNQSKKNKYKKLYLEEEETVRKLTKHYNERIKELEDKLEYKKRELRTTKTSKKTDTEERKLSTSKVSSINVPSSRQDSVMNAGAIEHHTLLFGNPYTRTPQPGETKPVYPYPLPKIAEKASTKPFDAMATGDTVQNTSSRNLPRPMEPTVLPSAKAAALKAACSTGDKPGADGHAPFFDSSEPIPDLADNIDGERFLDALGDEMRICPRCNESFPIDMSEDDFSEHIASHFGNVCPVCKKMTDEGVSQKQFERHVNDCIVNQSDQ